MHVLMKGPERQVRSISAWGQELEEASDRAALQYREKPHPEAITSGRVKATDGCRLPAAGFGTGTGRRRASTD